jgi:hypothetical protein
MDNNFDTPLKVIIVHENTTSGLHAANMLQEIATRLKEQLGIEVDPWEVCSRVWRFDWLQNPKLCEQAVSESINSDMIIIATESCTELPAAVRSWIESVLPRKQGAAALVALLGTKDGLPSGELPSARYLRQLANHYQVDFLCQAPDPPATDKACVEPEPVLCGFEDQPALTEVVIHRHADQRGWGLND